MLQGIACRPLEAHYILINAGLRNNVVMKEVVVGESAPQIIIAPTSFSFYPGLTLSAESQARHFPLLAGIFERGSSGATIFGCQGIQVEPAGKIAVQKCKRPALCWLQHEPAF